MKTLNNFWEGLVSTMKCYDEKVFATINAKVDNVGKITFTCFISLGEYPNRKQTGIHDANSIEELIQKAEGWAKIMTTKLDAETKDVALSQ